MIAKPEFLTELSKLVTGELSAETAEYVDKIIFPYGTSGSDADGAILVLGNAEETADRAPEALWQFAVNPERCIILSGGAKVPGSKITEAELMAGYIASGCVPGDKLFIENKSRTTIENFSFSAEYFNISGKNRLMIVTSSYHMRRSEQYFLRSREKYTGLNDYILCPSEFPCAMQETWHLTERGRNIIATELRLLGAHISEGIIDSFEI